MQKKKIAVVYPTGRKTVGKVANMLARRLSENGHQEDNEFHLVVSYDPTFYGLTKDRFKVEGQAEDVFSSISYVGPGEGIALASEMGALANNPEAGKILFEPRGYCSQKNRALVSALRMEADHIFFLDDDEYYTVPFKRHDGSLQWESQDIFGVHMASQGVSDITNGSHTGYFSPVPSEIDTRLEFELRERLGRILAIGNEVITAKTFITTQEAVRYASREFLMAPPYEVPMTDGIKFLTGGNIALNAQSIRDGKIPPYFNPVGARGEDAILGMQLEGATVTKVPVYTFHDPFQKYVAITEGQEPESIAAIAVIPGTIDRFCRACVGWVRYAPFLIRMTTGSEEEYQERIGAMQAELSEIGYDLDSQLEWDGFNKLGPTLDQYHERSKQDYGELQTARQAWGTIVERL